MRRWWPALSWALVFGCDEVAPPAATPDAGSAVDAGFAEVWPTPPIEATPPMIGPCPPGWRAVTAGDITSCDPWPDNGWVDCSAGAAHFPGTEGCAPLGRCPAGAWADDLPATGVIYVQAGAAGGDGSMQRPFATIGAATRAGGVARLIAVAKGEYAERVQLPAGFTRRTCTTGGQPAASGRLRLLPATHLAVGVPLEALWHRGVTIGRKSRCGVPNGLKTGSQKTAKGAGGVEVAMAR